MVEGVDELLGDVESVGFFGGEGGGSEGEYE